MKRHKSIGPMLRNGEVTFWTPVNFEVEYFLNEETEGVLTDTVIYFSDQHLTWLSQFKPNAKVGSFTLGRRTAIRTPQFNVGTSSGASRLHTRIVETTPRRRIDDRPTLARCSEPLFCAELPTSCWDWTTVGCGSAGPQCM